MDEVAEGLEHDEFREQFTRGVCVAAHPRPRCQSRGAGRPAQGGDGGTADFARPSAESADELRGFESAKQCVFGKTQGLAGVSGEKRPERPASAGLFPWLNELAAPFRGTPSQCKELSAASIIEADAGVAATPATRSRATTSAGTG
ncbi:MAG TPA: hypothetical protein VFV17_07825, partial [Usitatibacteraceae bacterium]|nr:hypothetical protein [Usitatibacteraceae bacterium]